MLLRRAIFITVCLLTAFLSARADCPISLDMSMSGGGGHGKFAPYYMAANNHGKLTQGGNLLLDLSISSRHTLNPRLSYRWGAEIAGGYSTDVTYSRYDATVSSWVDNPQHPPRLWLQQLYGRIDYRSLFLSAGLWESTSALLNDRLSSGDLVEGSIARPVPQVRVGFNNFQPIPFTHGWVEIQGEVAYGKMSDNGWIKDHTNLWNNHVCLGSLYTYKRCYFRTKSSMPLTLTLGMQTAGFFGGTTTDYNNGAVTAVTRHNAGIKEFFKMFFPTGGDELYYLGSTLGSWDIMFTYRLPRNKGILKAYLSKPWETGSGIGFLNGFDGLWGLEYRATSPAIIDGIVVEYLDFTNQSGPIHYDPADRPGVNFPYHTDGCDDYYNNYTYNAYANYGMSLGTPFLKSPIYNRDGYMAYIDNVVKGFHVGIEGTVGVRFNYRVLGGYRKGWGTMNQPRVTTVDDTSIMVEGSYRPPRCNDALTVTAKLAMDRGTMYGDTFGTLVTVRYITDFNSFRKR